MHDENGNQDLDMAGDYPTESYGVSGAKNANDNPSFQEAAVWAATVSISMFYYE